MFLSISFYQACEELLALELILNNDLSKIGQI